jgi:biopolymer transport protein ExbD
LCVILRCDKNVKYEYVDRVVEILKLATVTKMRLVADAPPGK